MIIRYQRIHTKFWHDEKIRRLSEDARLLFLYILTCPHGNAVGVFVMPEQYACADLGDWNLNRFRKAFAELLREELILSDEISRLLCISNHLKHNPIENENQAKAASRIVAALPKSGLYSTILERLNKPFHEPLRERLRERIGEPVSVSVTVAESRTGNAKGKTTFSPPSLEEVQAYCIEKNIGINFKMFVDYYQSNGWRVGKNSMRDWKAAIRTWERRSKEQGQFKGPLTAAKARGDEPREGKYHGKS